MTTGFCPLSTQNKACLLWLQQLLVSQVKLTMKNKLLFLPIYLEELVSMLGRGAGAGNCRVLGKKGHRPQLFLLIFFLWTNILQFGINFMSNLKLPNGCFRQFCPVLFLTFREKVYWHLDSALARNLNSSLTTFHHFQESNDLNC